MQSILLHCEQPTAIKDIKDFLEAKLPYRVYVSVSDQEAHHKLNQLHIHCVVNVRQSFDAKDFHNVHQLKASGYSLPILVVADEIDPAMKKTIAGIERLHVVEQPFDLYSLKGLISKLIQLRNVPKQHAKRFRTNQSMQVECYTTGKKSQTSLLNLSASGAYFESKQNYQVSIGDLLKMSVQVSEESSNHMINARVVWKTPKGPYLGGYGMGVKFVKNEEVIRHLMNED